MTQPGQSDIDSPATTDGKAEIEAMRAMVELLDPFSDDAVRRMLEWLLAREYDLTGVTIDAIVDAAR